MKTMQATVKEFCDTNNLHSPPEFQILDTLSELGEVAKEILKATDYGTSPFAYRDELQEELGDLLFSLTTVANSLDIDLEDALNTAMEKYNRRLEEGSAGSEGTDC